MIWIPRLLLTCTVLIFLWSALKNSPAVALVLEGLFATGSTYLMLAIYSELLELRQALAPKDLSLPRETTTPKEHPGEKAAH